ncbi:hypothetical protein N7495_002469 [Penicillium taxi]|uniref:uncharacterized protein n=1 Tax=Penicillium taxi TaxID=168475 RepID=UPI00254511F4|nr:uncharacterized protein N7495_002469 [Penicillium taxi]KAJ5901941.1 hypothetical protein N7495_002469 [Penicillium taxi]
MMTSCFSGEWAVIPDLASSTGRRATAAGPMVGSESWPESRSLGRSCGSLYIFAMLNALRNTTDVIPSEGAITWTTRQFACEISNQLLNVTDTRFGHSHEHQFSVQDDEWEELEEVSARQMTDIRLNRSLTLEAIQRQEATHTLLTIARGRFGGSMRALKRQIRASAIQYMNGRPGRDSLEGNNWAHARIKHCVEDPDNTFFDNWEVIWNILSYPHVPDTANGPGCKFISATTYLTSHDKAAPWTNPSQHFTAVLIESGLTMVAIKLLIKHAEKKVNTTVSANIESVRSSMKIKFSYGIWSTVRKAGRRLSVASTVSNSELRP